MIRFSIIKRACFDFFQNKLLINDVRCKPFSVASFRLAPVPINEIGNDSSKMDVKGVNLYRLPFEFILRQRLIFLIFRLNSLQNKTFCHIFYYFYYIC